MISPEQSNSVSNAEAARQSRVTLRRDRAMAMLAGMGLLLTYGLIYFDGFLLSWIFEGDTPTFDWVDPTYLVLFFLLVVLFPATLLLGIFATYRLARHALSWPATIVVTLLAGVPGLSIVILTGLVVRTARQLTVETTVP